MASQKNPPDATAAALQRMLAQCSEEELDRRIAALKKLKEPRLHPVERMRLLDTVMGHELELPERPPPARLDNAATRLAWEGRRGPIADFIARHAKPVPYEEHIKAMREHFDKLAELAERRRIEEMRKADKLALRRRRLANPGAVLTAWFKDLWNWKPKKDWVNSPLYDNRNDVPPLQWLAFCAGGLGLLGIVAWVLAMLDPIVTPFIVEHKWLFLLSTMIISLGGFFQFASRIGPERGLKEGSETIIFLGLIALNFGLLFIASHLLIGFP